MVSKALEIGEPAICVKADKSKAFNVGDATYVNTLVSIPTPKGIEHLAMVQKKEGGFIYLPSKLFRGLTDAEKASYEAMLDGATSTDEASN